MHIHIYVGILHILYRITYNKQNVIVNLMIALNISKTASFTNIMVFCYILVVCSKIP